MASSLNPSFVGNAVTFTATVSPGSSLLIPTGTVIFKDGATQIGTGALNNVSGIFKATFTTTALPAGSHPITAVYSGDANFNSSTSAILTQTVTAPSPLKTNITSEVKGMEVVVMPLTVKAYPNPTEHQFMLKVESSSNEKIEVVVYDVLGRIVKHFEKGDSRYYRFGEGLKVGSYFAEVRQGNEKKTVKLIKQ